MEHIESLQIESKRIAASPHLARCPKLKALLLYLLDRGGTPGSPTQFEIATQGLGRSSRFDETTDTSVRTSITRLRRALAAYYAVEQPHGGMYVYIKPGDYRLRLGSLDTAYPDLAGQSKRKGALASPPGDIIPTADTSVEDNSVQVANLQPARKARWRFSATGLVGKLLSLSVVAAATLAYASSSSTSGPEEIQSAAPPEAPSVAFKLKFPEGRAESTFADTITAQAQNILHKSMISRVQHDDDVRFDYRIDLVATDASEGRRAASLSLIDAQGIILAEDSIRLSGSEQADLAILRNRIGDYISPTGAIAQDLQQKIGTRPASGFECFLLIENARATGSDLRQLASACVRRFPQSRFLPYLRSREIFYRIQPRMMAGGSLATDTREWRDLSALLSEHEANPYVLALAAKVLVGQGRCREARDFASRSFSRGRTYAAIELSIIVDALGCRDLSPEAFAFFADRIDQIALVEDRPSPLVESYLVLGRLALGQRGEARKIVSRPFRNEHVMEAPASGSPLEKMVMGQGNEDDLRQFEAQLHGLIFNQTTRDLIVSGLSA